jgi:hypothetical protein
MEASLAKAKNPFPSKCISPYANGWLRTGVKSPYFLGVFLHSRGISFAGLRILSIFIATILVGKMIA